MNNPFQLIQKLDDGTHDIEASIELPETGGGDGNSIVVRCSKDDGKTYMTISHEVDGCHEILGDFPISEKLFDKLATA
jgi:hypothetical protein